MPENLELVKAEQQLTGFHHAYSGFDIISLIEEMGLRSEEWEELKESVPWLHRDLIADIDEYFETHN